MPDILEDEFKKTLSNIKDFTVKSNNENTSISEIEKYLIEAADKNSSQEKSEKEHGDDLGYCTNSNNTTLESEQDFEADLINDCASESSVEDLNYVKFLEGLKYSDYPSQQDLSNRELVDGSEYSPRALDNIRFLKEIQNLSQKDEEDEYNAETEKTATSCAESALQDDDEQATYSYSSDWSSEEDSSCSSDHLLPEDSFLMKLEVPLTENEENFIHEFYQKMEEVEAQNDQERKENIHNQNINCTENALKRIKCLVDEYLKRGIRLNSSYNDSTVTNLIFERIIGVLDSIVRVTYNTRAYGKLKQEYSIDGKEDFKYDGEYDEDELLKGNSLEIIKSVIEDLLLRGGKVKHSSFYYERLTHVTYDIDSDLFDKCREIDNKFRSVAYKSVINKSKRRDDFKVAIDNGYFYIEYEKGSVVELSRITNGKTIDDLNSEYKLNLKVGILQIGESVIRVEKLGEKRNYTDVPQGKIKMTFTTEVEDKTEKISILLYSDKEDSSKIKVELDEENQKKFNKLKDKSSLGKNCFLGGKSVIQAIHDKEFTKHESCKPETPPILPTLLEQCSISSVFNSLKDQYMQFQNYLTSG